jgi:hypothetical protein
VFIIWEGRGGSIRKGVLSSQLYWTWRAAWESDVLLM